MVTFLTILSLTLGFLGSVAALLPWHDLLCRFRLRWAKGMMKDTLKLVDRAEVDVERALKGKIIANNDYLVGKLWGILFAHGVHHKTVDASHAAYRSSLGLQAYSLRDQFGSLSRPRIFNSFYQIFAEFDRQLVESEPRDLRILAFWLYAAALASALSAFLLQS